MAGGRNGIYFRETLPTSSESERKPSSRDDGFDQAAPRSPALPWIIMAVVLGLLVTGAILGGM